MCLCYKLKSYAMLFARSIEPLVVMEFRIEARVRDFYARSNRITSHFSVNFPRAKNAPTTSPTTKFLHNLICNQTCSITLPEAPKNRTPSVGRLSSHYFRHFSNSSKHPTADSRECRLQNGSSHDSQHCAKFHTTFPHNLSDHRERSNARKTPFPFLNRRPLLSKQNWTSWQTEARTGQLYQIWTTTTTTGGWRMSVTEVSFSFTTFLFVFPCVHCHAKMQCLQVGGREISEGLLDLWVFRFFGGVELTKKYSIDGKRVPNHSILII